MKRTEKCKACLKQIFPLKKKKPYHTLFLKQFLKSITQKIKDKKKNLDYFSYFMKDIEKLKKFQNQLKINSKNYF